LNITWIKYEDECPKEEGWYLWTDGSRVMSAYYHPEYKWSDEQHSIFAPSHWSLLPEPPKKEKSISPKNALCFCKTCCENIKKKDNKEKIQKSKGEKKKQVLALILCERCYAIWLNFSATNAKECCFGGEKPEYRPKDVVFDRVVGFKYAVHSTFAR